MNLYSLEQLPKLFSGKSHALVAVDKSGNLTLFDPASGGETTCRLVVNWKSVYINDRLQNAKLARLFRACIGYNENSDEALPPPVRLESKNGATVFVDVIPLPRIFRDKLDGARSLLCIREVESAETSIKKVLQQVFRLTPAEASIAVLLTEGLSLKLAASNLHVSIWTARSHLRAIFQKTNTHRQAELVSLLAHLEF